MAPDHLTQLIIDYRYWIIIPLSFLEGPVIALVVGTLSSFGYFNPFVAVWIFFVKDMVMDGGWYFIGRYAKNTAFVHRLLHKGGLLTESTEQFKEQWQKRGWWTMFVAKLPHGFSSAFLAMSGLIEAPLGKFFTYAAIIALLQYGLLFVLGYYFGSFFASSPDLISKVQYILTGLLFIIGAYLLLVWYLRRRFAKKTPPQHPPQ
jgi:membrane protein DedA with SNARE-associated domain